MEIVDKIKQNFYSIYIYIQHRNLILTTWNKKFNFRNVRMLKFFHWHHGCFYFKGTDKLNRSIFLKTDFYLGLIDNEIRCISLLKKDSNVKNYIPDLLYHSSFNDFKFIAISYIDGITLKDYINRGGTLTISIVEQLVTIITRLQKNKIVHRDIRDDNVFLQETHGLILIDYSFAISSYEENGLKELSFEDKNKTKKILQGLGRGLNPKPLFWDDAYSLKKILFIIDKSFDHNFPVQFQQIDNLIGKLTYEYQDKSSY